MRGEAEGVASEYGKYLASKCRRLPDGKGTRHRWTMSVGLWMNIRVGAGGDFETGCQSMLEAVVTGTVIINQNQIGQFAVRRDLELRIVVEAERAACIEIDRIDTAEFLHHSRHLPELDRLTRGDKKQLVVRCQANGES